MQFAVVLKAPIAFFIAVFSTLVLLGGPTNSAATVGLAGGHAPDRLLVVFKPNARPSDTASTLRSARATEISRIPDLGVHVMRVAPNRLEAALEALRRSPSVLYAEYDGIIQAADTIPNDPYWPSQSSDVHLRTPQAWDYSTGSPNVVIAVLDTGVDPTTPDLQGSFVPGYDFVNNDADPSDDHGHGTMAAGVAAARGNNDLGIAGYCWSCSIMPVKVMGADGTGLQSTLATGITWATDHGARVISMSVSGGAYSTLASAVKYAHSKGVVLVAAAGNSGSSTQSYPAAYPEVVGIGGSNPDDTLNGYSNYGSWVKVAAPWCNYATSMRQADGSYKYASFCGTSSATPAAAGVAALAFSYMPMASNTAIEQALEFGASPVVGTHQIAYGRIDAYATLLSLGAVPVGTAPLNSSPPTVNGIAQDGQTLTASPGAWTGTTPMTYSYQWQRCDAASANCADVSGATASTYPLATPDVGLTIRAAVTATNSYGSSSAPSAVTVAVASAPAPPAPPSSLTATFTGTLNKKQASRSFSLTVGSGQAVADLQFSKGQSLSLTLFAADGATVASASGPSVVELMRSLGAGTYRYVATGGNGASVSFSLTITYASP
jgi:Subtilase family